jgi:hypothetical protein
MFVGATLVVARRAAYSEWWAGTRPAPTNRSIGSVEAQGYAARTVLRNFSTVSLNLAPSPESTLAEVRT